MRQAGGKERDPSLVWCLNKFDEPVEVGDAQRDELVELRESQTKEIRREACRMDSSSNAAMCSKWLLVGQVGLRGRWG